MKILICDDKKMECDLLVDLLKATSSSLDIVIFNNPLRVLDYVQSNADIDACFLDIVMPEMDGVELAEKLRENKFEKEIVFLTTENNFASQSYKVRALNYLLKPPTPQTVASTMNALENAIKNGDNGGITIKTQGETNFILFRNICYVEASVHSVNICLLNNALIRAHVSFGEIEEQLLRDNRFSKCHRSYIINLNHAASVKNKEVIMNCGANCGAKIPISKGCSQVKNEILQWMFKENKN